jgi:hypothetical protein
LRYANVDASGGTLGRPGTPVAFARGKDDEREAQMDLLQVIGSDAAIFLFSVAGLVATAVAIVADTRTQKADELARASVRADRPL